MDNNSTLLNKPYFLHCKRFERNKTWHSVFYSYFLLSRTGPLILCLCHFVSFHFWPCHLNYKQILCTSQLLFCHIFLDFCSSHPSLYQLPFRAQLLDVLFTHSVTIMVDYITLHGDLCPVQAILIELGCSCRFHITQCTASPSVKQCASHRRYKEWRLKSVLKAALPHVFLSFIIQPAGPSQYVCLTKTFIFFSMCKNHINWLSRSDRPSLSVTSELHCYLLFDWCFGAARARRLSVPCPASFCRGCHTGTLKLTVPC